MYQYSPDEIILRVPKELHMALEKIHTRYHAARRELEKAVLSTEINDSDFGKVGKEANDSWIEYRKVNRAVHEYLKKKCVRKDTWDNLISNYA